jgi:hypothetical protein
MRTSFVSDCIKVSYLSSSSREESSIGEESDSDSELDEGKIVNSVKSKISEMNVSVTEYWQVLLKTSTDIPMELFLHSFVPKSGVL